MNPLGLDPRRFTVACEGNEDTIVGFGQLVEHDATMCELRSLFVKEGHRCAPACVSDCS